MLKVDKDAYGILKDQTIKGKDGNDLIFDDATNSSGRELCKYIYVVHQGLACVLSPRSSAGYVLYAFVVR